MPAARGFIPDDWRASAHVSDAPLGCFLGWRFWLCRKLKHRCLLTLEYVRQENRGAVRKFECVMMHPRLVFVDLPKDCRPEVYRFCPPRGEAKGSRTAFHFLGKSKLCSGKNAHRRCGIVRRSKPSSTSVEVDCPELVTDLGRPGLDAMETVVTHGRGTPLTSRSPRPCPFSKIGAEFQSRNALRAWRRQQNLCRRAASPLRVTAQRECFA
jgi:hypothetical protein